MMMMGPFRSNNRNNNNNNYNSNVSIDQIPSLTNWSIDPTTNQVTGIVNGHPVVPDGEVLTTAPLQLDMNDNNENNNNKDKKRIIVTQKGTQYKLLTPASATFKFWNNWNNKFKPIGMSPSSSSIKQKRIMRMNNNQQASSSSSSASPRRTGFYYSTQLPYQDQLAFLEELTSTVKQLAKEEEQQQAIRNKRKNINNNKKDRKGNENNIIPVDSTELLDTNNGMASVALGTASVAVAAAAVAAVSWSGIEFLPSTTLSTSSSSSSSSNAIPTIATTTSSMFWNHQQPKLILPYLEEQIMAVAQAAASATTKPFSSLSSSLSLPLSSLSTMTTSKTTTTTPRISETERILQDKLQAKLFANLATDSESTTSTTNEQDPLQQGTTTITTTSDPTSRTTPQTLASALDPSTTSFSSAMTTNTPNAESTPRTTQTATEAVITPTTTITATTTPIQSQPIKDETTNEVVEATTKISSTNTHTQDEIDLDIIAARIVQEQLQAARKELAQQEPQSPQQQEQQQENDDAQMDRIKLSTTTTTTPATTIRNEDLTSFIAKQNQQSQQARVALQTAQESIGQLLSTASPTSSATVDNKNIMDVAASPAATTTNHLVGKIMDSTNGITEGKEQPSKIEIPIHHNNNNQPQPSSDVENSNQPIDDDDDDDDLSSSSTSFSSSTMSSSTSSSAPMERRSKIENDNNNNKNVVIDEATKNTKSTTASMPALVTDTSSLSNNILPNDPTNTIGAAASVATTSTSSASSTPASVFTSASTPPPFNNDQTVIAASTSSSSPVPAKVEADATVDSSSTLSTLTTSPTSTRTTTTTTKNTLERAEQDKKKKASAEMVTATTNSSPNLVQTNNPTLSDAVATATAAKSAAMEPTSLSPLPTPSANAAVTNIASTTRMLSVDDDKVPIMVEYTFKNLQTTAQQQLPLVMANGRTWINTIQTQVVPLVLQTSQQKAEMLQQKLPEWIEQGQHVWESGQETVQAIGQAGSETVHVLGQVGQEAYHVGQQAYHVGQQVGQQAYHVGQQAYHVGQEVGQQAYHVGQQAYHVGEEVGQQAYHVGQQAYHVGQQAYHVGQQAYHVGHQVASQVGETVGPVVADATKEIFKDQDKVKMLKQGGIVMGVAVATATTGYTVVSRFPPGKRGSVSGSGGGVDGSCVDHQRLDEEVDEDWESEARSSRNVEDRLTSPNSDLGDGNGRSLVASFGSATGISNNTMGYPSVTKPLTFDNPFLVKPESSQVSSIDDQPKRVPFASNISTSPRPWGATPVGATPFGGNNHKKNENAFLKQPPESKPTERKMSTATNTTLNLSKNVASKTPTSPFGMNVSPASSRTSFYPRTPSSSNITILKIPVSPFPSANTTASSSPLSPTQTGAATFSNDSPKSSPFESSSSLPFNIAATPFPKTPASSSFENASPFPSVTPFPKVLKSSPFKNSSPSTSKTTGGTLFPKPSSIPSESSSLPLPKTGATPFPKVPSTPFGNSLPPPPKTEATPYLKAPSIPIGKTASNPFEEKPDTLFGKRTGSLPWPVEKESSADAKESANTSSSFAVSSRKEERAEDAISHKPNSLLELGSGKPSNITQPIISKPSNLVGIAKTATTSTYKSVESSPRNSTVIYTPYFTDTSKSGYELLAKKPNAINEDAGLQALYQAILAEKQKNPNSAVSSTPSSDGSSFNTDKTNEIASSNESSETFKYLSSNSSPSKSNSISGGIGDDWSAYFSGDKVDSSNPTVTNYYAALGAEKDKDCKEEKSRKIDSNGSGSSLLNPFGSMPSSIPSILKDSANEEESIVASKNGQVKQSLSSSSESSSFAPSTPAPSVNGFGISNNDGRKDPTFIRPIEGYGALASKKPMNDKTGTTTVKRNDGGWSLADNKSQQDLMYEAFTGGDGNWTNENDDAIIVL